MLGKLVTPSNPTLPHCRCRTRRNTRRKEEERRKRRRRRRKKRTMRTTMRTTTTMKTMNWNPVQKQCFYKLFRWRLCSYGSAFWQPLAAGTHFRSHTNPPPPPRTPTHTYTHTHHTYTPPPPPPPTHTHTHLHTHTHTHTFTHTPIHTYTHKKYFSISCEIWAHPCASCLSCWLLASSVLYYLVPT